jgi:long-chain fatty acid transport protein
MTTPFQRTRIATAVAGIALALAAGQAFAAGFALQENAGSGLGNAFAGGAAVAEDANTVWANPAGMSRINTNQLVGTVYLLNVSMKFSNGASIPAAQQSLGGDGGDAGKLNVIPNLYFVMPFDKQWAFGIGVNAPFGLVTDYDSSWIGRFQGVKSDIKTMNINPALSWKPVDSFAIGVGADYQQIKATLTSQFNYSAALLGTAAAPPPNGLGIPPGSATFNAIAQSTPGLQSSVDVTGDDWAWGWNVGVLWDIDKNNRIGAHYRSSIKYDVVANATFVNPTLPPVPTPIAPIVTGLSAAINAGGLYNGSVTSKIELPEIVNVSYFGKLNDRWDIMADLQYTGWSKIQDLTFTRTSGPASGTVLSSTPEKWDDVWRFAVGANYHHDDKWLFRGGVAWDQSPVSDTYRTPRLPDGDRIWLATGAQYKLDRQWVFDIGLAYGWANSDPSIHQNAGSTAQYALIDGSYKVNFLIVSGQVAYSF